MRSGQRGGGIRRRVRLQTHREAGSDHQIIKLRFGYREDKPVPANWAEFLARVITDYCQAVPNGTPFPDRRKYPSITAPDMWYATSSPIPQSLVVHVPRPSSFAHNEVSAQQLRRIEMAVRDTDVVYWPRDVTAKVTIQKDQNVHVLTSLYAVKRSVDFSPSTLNPLRFRQVRGINHAHVAVYVARGRLGLKTTCPQPRQCGCALQLPTVWWAAWEM